MTPPPTNPLGQTCDCEASMMALTAEYDQLLAEVRDPACSEARKLEILARFQREVVELDEAIAAVQAESLRQ